MRYEDIRKMNILKETMLYKFYNSFSASVRDGYDFKTALLKACTVDGKLVFDLKLDYAWFVLNEVRAYNALQSFEGFKKLVDKGYIEVKPHNKNAEDENTAGL